MLLVHTFHAAVTIAGDNGRTALMCAAAQGHSSVLPTPLKTFTK